MRSHIIGIAGPSSSGKTEFARQLAAKMPGASIERTAATRRIQPSPHLIVEGLFVLYWPELRAILDTKVFVQTDPGVCFNSRLTNAAAGGR